MRFEDYFLGPQNIHEKSLCPDDCPLKARRDIPIVGIPLPPWPTKIAGVLVSRDPPSSFLKTYTVAREGLTDEWRILLMSFVNAPPQWLIWRISIFDRKYRESAHEAGIENLTNVIDNNVYWTHLHKCFTDKKGEEAPVFDYANAERCGNMWLRQEILDAVKLGAKFVLCLGSDVERYVATWDTPLKEQVKVLYLPYPSPLSMGAWNPKDPEKLEKIAGTIDELFRIVNEFSPVQ